MNYSQLFGFDKKDEAKTKEEKLRIGCDNLDKIKIREILQMIILLK